MHSPCAQPTKPHNSVGESNFSVADKAAILGEIYFGLTHENMEKDSETSSSSEDE